MQFYEIFSHYIEIIIIWNSFRLHVGIVYLWANCLFYGRISFSFVDFMGTINKMQT